MEPVVADLDQKQVFRDLYRLNRYRLDDRFVLRDKRTHPFAVICPGGGPGTVTAAGVWLDRAADFCAAQKGMR